MSFPLSPSNNQIALVNGIEYYYHATKGAWYRYGDGSANVITSNTFQVLSSIIFSDGTSQSSAPTNIDSYARTTANTATDNITIIQGVNVTQNTNITIATNAATAAFAQANATAGGLTSANTRLTIIEGVDADQNTRMSIIEGVDTTQNTRLTIIEGVNTTQNSNITTANTPAGSDTQVQFNDGGIRAGSSSLTFNKTSGLLSSTLLRSTQSSGDEGGQLDLATAAANTSLSGGYVNIDVYQNKLRFFEAGGTNRGAFIDLSIAGTGVSSNLLSVGAGGGGSGIDQYARDTANLAIGIDATQNTNITIATNAATASFAQANATAGGLTTANTNITAADTKAQAAFDKANSAYTLANTANAAASSGGSGGGNDVFTTYTDTFTGNGSQTQFSLSVTPENENQTMVFLNGIYQNKDTYSVSNNLINFTDTATSNDTIEVFTFARVTNVNTSMYITRIYQGDGTTNTFTISSGHTSNTILVFNNGVAQFPVDDYTVNGTIVTYIATPQSDETIQIRELPVNTMVATTQQALMRRYTANGAQTQFTVTNGQTANSLLVFENGICQVPVNDYTVSGTTLTFVTAPVANVVVQIRELSI